MKISCPGLLPHKAEEEAIKHQNDSLAHQVQEQEWEKEAYRKMEDEKAARVHMKM